MYLLVPTKDYMLFLRRSCQIAAIYKQPVHLHSWLAFDNIKQYADKTVHRSSPIHYSISYIGPVKLKLATTVPSVVMALDLTVPSASTLQLDLEFPISFLYIWFRKRLLWSDDTIVHI